MQDLVEICKQVGLSEETIKKYMALTTSDTIKEKLKKTTDEAVTRGQNNFPILFLFKSLGAFGAPTFFVRKLDSSEEEEMFFGSDRFHVFCSMFDLPWDGPIPKDLKAKL